MRKSEKTTFQWPKVSKLLTTLPRHRANIKTGLRFLFRAPEVPVLRVRKSHFRCFSSLQKRHFRCPKRKSETCSEIRSVRLGTSTTVICSLFAIGKWFSRFFSFYIGLSLYFMYLRKFKFRKRGRTSPQNV